MCRIRKQSVEAPSSWQQDKQEDVRIWALNCYDIPSHAHYHLRRLWLPASHLCDHSRSWLSFWQSLKDECCFLLGRREIAPILFSINSWCLFTWRTALLRGCASHGLWSYSPALGLLSSGHPWKLQGGWWKPDVVRRAYGAPLAHMIYILMDSWRQGLKWCLP